MLVKETLSLLKATEGTFEETQSSCIILMEPIEMTEILGMEMDEVVIEELKVVGIAFKELQIIEATVEKNEVMVIIKAR